jgi:FeS assembly SUF system regulator
MLKISKLADYAILIVSYMAQQTEQVLSAKQIATGIHIGLPTVSKVLKLLGAAQIVISYRGIVGGYQLAQATDQITLAQIVTAIEGQVAMTECCSTDTLCVLDAICAIKENWKTINKIILTALGSLTLADMMKPLNGVDGLTLKGIPITVQGF